MKHKHEFTRSKPGATVETCRCGKFRHTENAGPAIAAQDLKHTPGPWAIARADGAPIIYQEGKDSSHFQPSAICEVYRYGGTRPTDANARLIAAAPDLLEAARQVLWKLSHNFSAKGDGSDGKPGTVDRNDATVRMLKAALLAATEGK